MTYKHFTELYGYATRMVTYDMDVVRNYVRRPLAIIQRKCMMQPEDIIR